MRAGVAQGRLITPCRLESVCQRYVATLAPRRVTLKAGSHVLHPPLRITYLESNFKRPSTVVE